MLKVLLLSLIFINVIGCSAPAPKQPKGKWEMVNPAMQKQKTQGVSK